MTDAARMLAHILVVDDDDRLRGLLRKYLSDNGFVVTTAGDAGEARARLAGIAFDLMVLDVMMPGETGLELTRSLRQAGNSVPILLLTALGETLDRINGLETGADDYLTKPFEPRELLLRIGSILRRVPRDEPVPAAERLGLGAYVFDVRQALLTHDGEVVHLTSGESTLLLAMARHAGRTLSREELGELTGNAGNLRSVDVQVTRLRKKIEDDSRLPRYIQTVRGQGYLLRPD